jgi:hypothetical protein
MQRCSGLLTRGARNKGWDTGEPGREQDQNPGSARVSGSAASGDGCCLGAGCLEMHFGVRPLGCHRVGRPRGGWEGGGAGRAERWGRGQGGKEAVGPRERNPGRQQPRARLPPGASGSLSRARRALNGSEISGCGGGGGRNSARWERGCAPAARRWAGGGVWVPPALAGQALCCLPPVPKGGAEAAELSGGGGENMVRRFLVTVRIQRPGGPPRVRTFVVQFPRPVGEQAAPSARTVAALVLMRVRSQSRQLPRPERPGRKGPQKIPGATTLG